LRSGRGRVIAYIQLVLVIKDTETYEPMKIHHAMTKRQLSEHFRITAPAMSSLLIGKGLADGNGPTKAGHLHGGARYVEVESEFGTRRWPSWPIERIAAIFPELESNRSKPATTFKTRYAAMEAIKDAGVLMSQLFKGGTLPTELAWMISDPGRGGLEATTDKRTRLRWCERNLVPIQRRMADQSKKLSGHRLETAEKASAILDGVIHWLLGKPQTKIEPGPRFAPTLLDVRLHSHDESNAVIRLHASTETVEVLTAGYLFGDFRQQSEDQSARDAILRPLDRFSPPSFQSEEHADWAAFTRNDGRQNLVRVHAGREAEICSAVAFSARMDDGGIEIETKPSMIATLERGETSWDVKDHRGETYLAMRAAALLPVWGPIC
jgi:hypothetical protein